MQDATLWLRDRLSMVRLTPWPRSPSWVSARGVDRHCRPNPLPETAQRRRRALGGRSMSNCELSAYWPARPKAAKPLGRPVLDGKQRLNQCLRLGSSYSAASDRFGAQSCRTLWLDAAEAGGQGALTRGNT